MGTSCVMMSKEQATRYRRMREATDHQEETMVSRAMVAKEVEVDGARLRYVEHGSGEPIVFVHGAPHDLRAWEPVRGEIAKRYRFIAYTQRYFGTDTSWRSPLSPVPKHEGHEAPRGR